MDLDDRMSLVTPEGVVVEYSLADAGSRLAAALIDLTIQGVVVLVLLSFITIGTVGIAIFVVCTFVVLVGYPTALELWGDGQTLGKRVLGLQVRMTNGSSVGFLPSCIRNLLRLIDVLLLVGVVFIVATRKHQRLGDFAASTVVVRRKPLTSTVPIPSVQGGSFPYRMGTGWNPVASGATVSPQVAALDVSRITFEDIAKIQHFLARRSSLNGAVRAGISEQYMNSIAPRVGGLPGGITAEYALEMIVAAKTLRE